MAEIIRFPYRAAAYLTPEERERLQERRALRQAAEAVCFPARDSKIRRHRPGAWEDVVVQRIHEAMNYGLRSGDWQAVERMIDQATSHPCIRAALDED